MTRSPAWYRALARLPIKNVFQRDLRKYTETTLPAPLWRRRVKAPRFAHVESARRTLARRVASVVTALSC